MTDLENFLNNLDEKLYINLLDDLGVSPAAMFLISGLIGGTIYFYCSRLIPDEEITLNNLE